MAPEDVAVMSSNGHGERRICGFLTGQRDVAGWELFTGHRHPCPADGSIKVGAPRLPPLSSGELVDTVREVWCPDARSSCTRAVGAPLVAIVQQWCNAGRKQRRSYAVVGLPGGRLAWARLFGVGASKTCLLVPSTPPASAPADEFAALENVLPDFLARYTVDGVNNKLRHPGYTGGIHRPRPAVPTQLGPCQVDFSQDDVFELIVTKHFEPVVNLKGLKLNSLLACTSNQLTELCLLAGISPVPDERDLVDAILRFRDAQGRVRRGEGKGVLQTAVQKKSVSRRKYTYKQLDREYVYGGCRLRTQSLRDQLDRADAGSWQIADRGDLWTARAQVTSVGDLRVHFVVEP